MEPSNYAMRNIELKTEQDGKDYKVYVVCTPNDIHIGKITKTDAGDYEFRNVHNNLILNDQYKLETMLDIIKDDAGNVFNFHDSFGLENWVVYFKDDGTADFYLCIGVLARKNKYWVSHTGLPFAHVAPFEGTKEMAARLLSGEDILENETYRKFLEDNGYIQYEDWTANERCVQVAVIMMKIDHEIQQHFYENPTFFDYTSPREYDAFLTTLCDIYKLEREEREMIRKRYSCEALKREYMNEDAKDICYELVGKYAFGGQTNFIFQGEILKYIVESPFGTLISNADFSLAKCSDAKTFRSLLIEDMAKRMRKTDDAFFNETADRMKKR